MRFVEDTHKYYNTEEKEYLGATTFLGRYQNKKDWKSIAENYVTKRTREEVLKDLAKKWSITLDQAITKWDKYEFTGEWIQGVWASSGDIALAGGNMWHNFKELDDSTNIENVVFNPVKNNEKTFDSLEDLKPGFTYLELGVYSHLHELSGQADKVIITKAGKSIVRDYKSNMKPLTPEGVPFYNKELKRKVVEKLLQPVGHIIANDYWKYALQLSLYAYLIELHGIPNQEIWIEQIITKYVTPEKVKATDIILFEDMELNRTRVYVETVHIQMPYLKKEIKSLLKHRLVTL